MSFLSIKDLRVNIDDKEILNGVNLDVNKGEVHAIMGLNGSEKEFHWRMFYWVILVYSVISGDILVNDKSILKLKTDERAKKGLFLGFHISY